MIGSVSNRMQSAMALAAQIMNLAVQDSNDIHGLVNRSAELGSLTLPPPDAIHLGGPSSRLCVNLLAQLALGACGDGLHDELHAARLTHSVLLGAVLAEVAPLPIATGKAVLIEEAHVSSVKSGDACCLTTMSVVISQCLDDSFCQHTSCR
jgi:hypothetical protein